MLLTDLLVNSCRNYRDKTALIEGETGFTLTYGELLNQAKSFSARLAVATASPNIGILLPNSKEFVISFLGALLCGKTVVPLNYLLNQQEINCIVKDANIDLIITQSSFNEIAKTVAPPTGTSFTGTAGLPLILYTSGTCNQPKGVMLSNNNLLANIKSLSEAVTIKEFTFMGILPYFHAFGLTCGLLTPLLSGAAIVLTKRFNPAQAAELMERHHVNVMLTVPSVYRAFLRAPENNRPLGKIQFLISGGEGLPKDITEGYKRHFNQTIYEGYGLTETSPVISLNTPANYRFGSVGKPVSGVTVKIMEDGEIWVKGPNIMEGYYNQPELTAEVITQDGWFKTGDIGRQDEDGFLYITGRKKEMIISAGENIFPSEVECVLYEHPGIAECAVIGIPDKTRGEAIKAFVVAKDTCGILPEELKSFCRERLAPYKVPAQVEFRAQLPHGPTGKVLKKTLEC
ncbi:MAG: AMP-binding protein [Planctomycetes bacterium]|nr:AMP-binding protein [Planctomycetota bacterium]